MNDKAQFEITGTVSRKPYVGEKLAKVNLACADEKGRTTYLECVSFKPSEVAQLGEGARVTVKGRLNRRKMEGVQQPGKDGRMFDVWETQLIANFIAPEAVRSTAKPEPEPESDPDDIAF